MADMADMLKSFSSMMEGKQIPDNIKEAMGNELPIGRLGKDKEIANLICYLLSDDASFITGAIIPIDGGFTAK